MTQTSRSPVQGDRVHRPRRAGGFTLMEVLIALIVLAIGLLGLAALQAQGLKFNQDAYVRTQATVLAYDMIERLRMAGNAAAAAYVSAGAPPAGAVCDPTSTVAANELDCWYDAIEATMPGRAAAKAASQISFAADPPPNPTGTGVFSVTIAWTDRQSGNLISQLWTVRVE